MHQKVQKWQMIKGDGSDYLLFRLKENRPLYSIKAVLDIS